MTRTLITRMAAEGQIRLEGVRRGQRVVLVERPRAPRTVAPTAPPPDEPPPLRAKNHLADDVGEVVWNPAMERQGRAPSLSSYGDTRTVRRGA